MKEKDLVFGERVIMRIDEEAKGEFEIEGVKIYRLVGDAFIYEDDLYISKDYVTYKKLGEIRKIGKQELEEVKGEYMIGRII